MQIIIHQYTGPEGELKLFQDIYEGGWEQRQLSIWRTYDKGLKEWSGKYFINEQSTQLKVNELMGKRPIEIGDIFNGYEGMAHISNVIGSEPILVEFIGSGALFKDRVEL